MQLVMNERLVKRESRIGAILLGVTFCLLGAGLFVSLQGDSLMKLPWVENLAKQPGAEGPAAWSQVVLTYGIVLIGMGLYYLGNSRVKRFGPQYRQDQRLRQILKGLDDRHVLYTFLGRKLPDYVLVGPGGVHVLTTRGQRGDFVCRDDRWSRQGGAGGRIMGALALYGGNSLGSPSYDCQQATKQVRALLDQRLPDGAEVPVEGLVVFTAEGVKLRTERCAFPSATARESRKLVTRSKAKLSAGRLAEVRTVFEGLVAPS